MYRPGRESRALGGCFFLVSQARHGVVAEDDSRSVKLQQLCALAREATIYLKNLGDRATRMRSSLESGFIKQRSMSLCHGFEPKTEPALASNYRSKAELRSPN